MAAQQPGQLPIPTEGGEKWLSQHLCQRLDEAEAKQDPLSCSYADAKTKQSQYYGRDGEMELGDGFKSAYRGSEMENT